MSVAAAYCFSIEECVEHGFFYAFSYRLEQRVETILVERQPPRYRRIRVMRYGLRGGKRQHDFTRTVAYGSAGTGQAGGGAHAQPVQLPGVERRVASQHDDDRTRAWSPDAGSVTRG